MDLLDQVLHAVEDTTVTAPDETIFHALEQMCRDMFARLEDPMHYGPPAFAQALELGERLVWAAREAIRIFPSEAGPPLGHNGENKEA
jgi:hypothetical protein